MLHELLLAMIGTAATACWVTSALLGLRLLFVVFRTQRGQTASTSHTG